MEGGGGVTVAVDRYTDADRALVARLAAAGWGPTRISRETGIRYATVYRWTHPEYADRTRRSSRDSKRRLRGRCACGAETGYHGRDGKRVSDRCRSCANTENGLAKRGTGSVQQALLALCAEPRRPVYVADALGISRSHAQVTLHRLRRYGFVERVGRGLYRTVTP